jgi:hypothetical protein
MEAASVKVLELALVSVSVKLLVLALASVKLPQ